MKGKNIMAKFVKLTRLYSVDGSRQAEGTMKEGTIYVNPDEVVSVRARNTKGPKHRATLLLATGTYVNVTQKLSDVITALRNA